MTDGYIYIISNTSLKKRFIKIGKTNDPDRRIHELRSSGVPDGFKIEYCAFVKNFDDVEKKIHQKLNHFRHKKDREFFTCKIPQAIATIETIAKIEEIHTEYKNKQQIHDALKVLNKTENIRKDQEREENNRRLRQEREKNIRKDQERKERETRENIKLERERKERETRENIKLERERKFKDELPLKAVFFICGLFFIYMIGSAFKDDPSEALDIIIVLGGLFLLISVASLFFVLVSFFPYWFRRSIKKDNNSQQEKATTSDSHDETKDTVPNSDVINRGDNLITEIEGSNLIIICKHCNTKNRISQENNNFRSRAVCGRCREKLTP